jgi:hypothetical protein
MQNPIDSELLRVSQRRLGRSLEANKGRWGVFVMDAESPALRAAWAEIQDSYPRRVYIDVGDYPGWVALETAMAQQAPAADVIELHGLDTWLDPRNLSAANISREHFAQSVPVPVMFWLSSPQISSFATRAPDLWSWRAGVFD